MEQTITVSNLAELMIDRDAEQLLTVHGFTLNGSAYDRFARLCACVERAPTHPLSCRLQLLLEKFFSITLPMNTQNCGEIWKTTAEQMLLSDRDWTLDESKSRLEILPPRCSDDGQNACFDVHGLQIEAKNWQEWKREAEVLLLKHVRQGCTPIVSFDSDFVFEKPNLYRVERHLLGVEDNRDLWSAQLLYFACDFCYRHELRCRVAWMGDCEKMLELLQYVSKLTPISNLLLHCEDARENVLQNICRLVMASQTKRNEGTPPVLLVD